MSRHHERPEDVEEEIQAASPQSDEHESEDGSPMSYEDASVVGSEYPDDMRMLADTLITAHGEAIADVMAGIRDSLEKLNKILYSKLGK